MSGKLVAGGRYRHRLIQWLTKKPYRDHMRAPASQAPRSTPQPLFPPSQNSGVSANYYHSRDLRRTMGPPVSLLSQQIEAGSEQGQASIAVTAPVPGNVYNPGEDPYPHGVTLQDRLGDIRENPNQID